MPKQLNISILGATGSVGCSLVKLLRDNYKSVNIVSMSCGKNFLTIAKFAKEFAVTKLSIKEGYEKKLEEKLANIDFTAQISSGPDSLIQLAIDPKVDLLFILLSGEHGLKPLVAALTAGKKVALANKESLVLAGGLVNRIIKKHRGCLIPLDSEHNAIYQCLKARPLNQVKSIVLTSSGGPFLNTDKKMFKHITPKQALKHPKWSMGQKISIDSATMVNKCLEVIEAFFLFGCSAKMIKVLVHPQAIIHGIVDFSDGSSLSMISKTDMKVPLANCLGNYVSKSDYKNEAVDLSKIGQLNFKKVNHAKFPTVKFAYRLLEWGKGAPAYFNGANQRLVEKFLTEEIRFTDIFNNLQKAINKLDDFFKNPKKSPKAVIAPKTLVDSLQADLDGREFIDKIT